MNDPLEKRQHYGIPITELERSEYNIEPSSTSTGPTVVINSTMLLITNYEMEGTNCTTDCIENCGIHCEALCDITCGSMELEDTFNEVNETLTEDCRQCIISSYNATTTDPPTTIS